MTTTDMLKIRTYFGLTSLVNPEKAARKSLSLFQRVHKKTIRTREEDFFSSARKFSVTYHSGVLDCFEMGHANGELVILIHGWDSNAGSLSKLAHALADKGNRVISFNLPGHAHSHSNSTNLKECKDAFVALLDDLMLDQPFSVIAHSFGSAVASYSLAKVDYKIDKLVLLTNPNRIESIFKDFKKGIGLGNRAYQSMLRISKDKMGEPLHQLSVEENLQKINYSKLLLMHDRYDRVLPYHHSVEVNNAIENAQLITLEQVGHYKMLWNDEVINRCVGFVNGKEVF